MFQPISVISTIVEITERYDISLIILNPHIILCGG